MSSSIPAEQFVRTLVHYLDANESRLLAPPPLPSSPLLPKSEGDDMPSSPTTVGSMNTPSPTNRPSSFYGLQIPYMSLLAATAPNTTALSTTSYMPTRSCLTLDIHYLYFLLVQFEHVGLEIGDPALLGEIPAESLLETETTATAGKAPSVVSVGSIASTMSSMSLSSGWSFWTKRSAKKPANSRPINEDIVHIYDFFSRVAALKLNMHVIIDAQNCTTRSGQRPIAGFETPLKKDGSVRISLIPFHCLTFLELNGIHPRLIDGWSKYQSGLVSLIVKGAGVEDVTEVLSPTPSENEPGQWHRLKMLSLADNSLTIIEAAPLSHIRALTHLNLSSNLLVDVPSALSSLYNLQSLNLSHNMISSVTGINTVLGNILELDLRGNRLTMIAGLDRLWALERVDLRDNRIEDAAEVGRLTSLPNIEDIWMEGNPFVSVQSDYRVQLFRVFSEKDMDIRLDGTRPTFTERRHLPTKEASSDHVDLAATSAFSQTSAEGVKAGNEHATETAIPTITPGQATIARAKTKKAKRHIRLGKSDTNDSQSNASKNSDDERKHVHRLSELEKAVQGEKEATKTRTRQRRSHSTSSERSQSPGSTSKDKQQQRHSFSPLVTTAGDTFRKKVETMRREAGTGWLRVLREMELARKDSH